LVEQFLDRRAKKHELVSGSAAARAVICELLRRLSTGDRSWELEVEIAAADAAWRTSDLEPSDEGLDCIHANVLTIAIRTCYTERHHVEDGGNGATQVRLLRDIFGRPHPFPQVRLNREWMTADVLGLVSSIYEDRASDRLPIMADALEEVGCQDEEILGHCRAPGPHVRGCWVVDLVLGKE
jgi:hypothetical protein